MSYRNDIAFTEYVHNKIALEKIYKPLGWKKIKINAELAEDLDINQGIDRVFETNEGNIVTVQERFRIEQYKKYNDFTIRYTRDKNLHEDRRRSEFFKIEADYFVYGITNCENNMDRKCNDFYKFAVIDMKAIKNLLQDEIIIIDEDSQDKTSLLKDGKLIVPVLENQDSSSEFIALDIRSLCELENILDKKIILLQRGFNV